MNNRDFYKAFAKAKLIYGCTMVHVQLIARQLNVLASDVVDYILDNPALVSYEIKTQASGYSNPIMGNEYTGLYVKHVAVLPWLTSESAVQEGNAGATVIVEMEGSKFENAATTKTNWTVDAGTTGLTLSAIQKNSDTKCTLSFTGTAKPGDLRIVAKNAAIVADKDSDVLAVHVMPASLDYATVQSILARLDALETS